MGTSLTPRQPIANHLPVLERVSQGSGEVRQYSLSLNLFTAPTVPVVTVSNETTQNDVTATVLTSAGAIATVGTDTDLNFEISFLQPTNLYRVDMKFSTGDAETIEPYVMVKCDS